MPINKHVKLVIGLMVCPVHGQNPVLEMTGKCFTIECCCIDFKITCFKNVIKLMEADLEVTHKLGWTAGTQHINNDE